METTQAVNSFRNHIDIPFPKVKRLNTPRYSHPRNHFSCRVFPSSTSLTSPGSGCILLSRVDWYFKMNVSPSQGLFHGGWSAALQLHHSSLRSNESCCTVVPEAAAISIFQSHLAPVGIRFDHGFWSKTLQ